MNLTDLVSALVRYFALFAVLLATGLLLIAIAGPAAYEGHRTASLIEAGASGLIGGVAWILHRDLARWLLLSSASPVVQGVRTATFIYAFGLFARTLSMSVSWRLHQPQIEESPFKEMFVDSMSETVADATIFVIAVALLFLSPHIESRIERSKRTRRMRAEIKSESDLPV